MAVQINVAANQAALTASIQAGVQAYNQRFAQNNQLNLTVNQRAFSQPLGRMTGDVKDFEAALAASNARVIAFGASTAVLGGVIRSFKELANVTIEVEKNLADINRVFGLTTSQLQKFSTDLFNVTKQTASSFNDASQAALEFSRQGLKAEETLQRTKDALTLTRLAGISTANAVDALTSTVNGFAATGVTTSQILNKLVAVEQDFAVGAGDLAEALSRTGQAAQEAGVSLDQLNALVTSAQQSTARGGAVIGNALKTIFTRLQRTETLDQLEAFNIAVRDVQGNILPAVTILQNFAGAYRGLADAQRAQLSEQVAGVYQVNILKAIVNDLNKSQGVYAGALQRGAMATNEAEVATAKLNQTLDALLKQTATSTQQLANNIGKVTFEPLAKYGTEQLKSFVESMNEILEGEGVGSTFANGLLKGIRNVIAGPGAIAAFFTLFKLIQNSFTYLAQALPQIAGITTETQNRKNIEQSILQIMQQQGPASQALAGLMGNQAAQAQLLLQIARQQTAEYQTQSTLAKQLAAQLATQGVRVKGSGGLQVTRAGGYIPAATRMAEVVGAQAGGYAPGRVVSSPVGGVMNTAEDVKYIPGFAQPFINPPAGSKAGRAHRQNAISRTGVDPYMFRGFIPNFAEVLNVAKDPYTVKDGDTITADATIKRIRDFRLEQIDAIESNQLLGNDATNLAKKMFPNSESFTPTINASGKAAYDRLSFTSTALSDKLIDKGLGVPDLRYISGDAYINRTLYAKKAKKGIWSFINAAGNHNHPKAIQFLTQMGLSEEGDKDIKSEKMYKAAKAGRNKFLNSGFIPNFATPMTTASIPWFKKYSSKYKNAAGDADLFKMGDFPTYGRGSDHEYAKKGNANMLSYLHEDFVRSALNIALGSKQVIRPSEVGFRDKPISDIANENDFDLLYRIADGSYSMLELKQDFRNISGSVTGFMNKKLANLEKENPVLAKKVSSMIAVSNRPKFTDPTGRNAGANFSEFEMAAASIVKDKYSNVDPSISAKLTKVTDGLLRRYEAKKNTTYDGFIPNFAYKQAVMGLEESMSGNKAIFDTKPFPHIRNSSQPTFSSAITDHGGLGNALSDSMRGQKDAGLMSKGFVPNFAPRSYRYSGRGSVIDPGSGISQYSTGLGFSLADQERRARDEFNIIINALRTGAMNAQQATTAFNTLNTQAGLSARAQTNLTRILDREVNAAATASNSNTAGGAGGSRFSRFSRGLSRAGTAISIAGPTIAGFAEQSFFGDRKRSDMSSNERMAQSFASTGLSAVTTGVGIGAQAAGLPGALIGGAIGGLVAFKSALDSTSLSVDELKEKKEEEKNKTIENISSAERYLAIQEEISKSTSPKDIKNNLISLRKELSSIKDTDFADKIKIAGTDINALSEIVKQYSLKQKEATSALNDSIIVQKKYSLETLKSAANVKITGQGGSGKLAQTGKFLTGSYNMIAEFLGFKNIREEEMARVDLADKKTRETIYKENPNLFRTLSKIDPDALIEVGNVFASEVASNIGFGSFQTEELSKLLKQGGLQGPELEETIAVLKQAGDSSNLLGNALANNFFVAVNGFKKFDISQQTQLKNTENAAEAIADLNQQLKDFINNLDYAFKDLNRQNDFEKKLRGVQAPNRMMISESLYGKRDAIETQRYLDIQDIESERESKNLDISKKLLTTNIRDYYNLSDAQKTAYLQLSKSFDLSKPEKNLEKIEGFIKTQFGTLDPTTATDKQKDYLTIISNVRKDIAQTEKESADDLYLAAEKFKEALMAMELSRDFVFQFKAGFRDLATEGEMLIGTIGRQLPKMFADGLVDGIKAAIRESDNLGQALMGIASKFLDEISTMMMRSSIYQIMGSFAPSLVEGFGSASAIPVPRQKGGIIRAQSGMYISGSGSGDKYPALLENGEYVLNRRAVMAMGGPASLDQLNFAMAPRFASGGSFGNEFTDLKSMEANMTSYGMENSKLYGELRDAEISAAEERRRKAFARRQQRAALIGSAVAAVASIGLSAGVSNLSQNKLSAQAGALSGTQQAKDVATMPIPKGQPFAGSEVAQFVTPKQYGQINSLMRQGYLNSAGTSTTQSYGGLKGFFTGPTPYGQVPWYQRGSMNPFAPKIGGKQTGGLIGSRLSDTIPGYMEGGLYNTPMVKKYGVGMQSGGMSPVSNSNSNVVNTTNATNSFNFNTNVSRDGTIEVGSNSTSYAQQDVALSKNLNSKVYAVVLDAIKNEQRFGGSLAGTRQG